MAHLVDELRDQAEQAVESMRDAARHARAQHARAELMRHMLLTAGEVADRPRTEAIGYVVHHWLKAWGLDPVTWPHVAEMERFSGALHDYVRQPDDRHDADVRAAALALERAFAAAGMPLADQMAWRSECAHRWWADVVPPPAGRGRADQRYPAAPFWDKDCPAHCR